MNRVFLRTVGKHAKSTWWLRSPLASQIQDTIGGACVTHLHLLVCGECMDKSKLDWAVFLDYLELC